MIPIPVGAETAPPPAQQIEPNLLLFEVRLDQHVLSDSFTAYQVGRDIFLPLGELAKILTIGISTKPDRGVASGFVLHEDRTFSLNVAQETVIRNGQVEYFDPSLVFVKSDDIYVAANLITIWLPVDIDIELSTLVLTVQPRELLPLQLRLERERLASEAATQGRYRDPGYPRFDTPYQILGLPFIDQTLAFQLNHGHGDTEDDFSYTGYLTADFFGMESSLFVNDSKQDSSPDVRFTLGRHDPGARLLGPLHARTVEFGNVPVPGMTNISVTDPTGNGATISNRPLTQPDMFDLHTLQGNLPPGWDVELYYNDALIGFQQSHPDGLYTFADQPLLYGPNEFRLVFHGPLGQLRVERQVFFLEDSLPRPGEFFYSIAGHEDTEGQSHAQALFDYGVVDHLAINAGAAETPVLETQERYTNLGMRVYWDALILSGNWINQQDGGQLIEESLNSRIRNWSLDLRLAQLNDFTSELFLPTAEPVRQRNTLRITGVVPMVYLVLPVTVEATRDHLQSGDDNLYATGRISAFLWSTSFTNEIRWQSLSGEKLTEGNLQVSRRLAGVGFNGQINYTLQPENKLQTAALTATQDLGQGYLLNLGLAHAFTTPQTLYTAGVSKNLGRFGFSINSSYATTGEVAVGMQLFVATGIEPRRSEWLFDAQPMANSGAISARVFLDQNLNGVMDPGEEAIKGAGLTLNGGRQGPKTDTAGIAFLNHLPVFGYTDIAVDPSTLEDPQWSARPGGIRVVPRPGKVIEVELPVVMTGEIDGIVYLAEIEGRRGIGDVRLELVDDSGKVVGGTTTGSDGYYIVPSVLPGNYKLRISPDQLSRLDLKDPGAQPITMSPDGDFVNGVDFVLTPKEESAPRQDPPASPVPKAVPAPVERKEDGAAPDPPDPDPHPIKKGGTGPAPSVSLSDSRAATNFFTEGVSMYSHADFPGAVRALEQSVRLNPYSAWAYYFLGYLHYEMKEFSKAQEAFSRAYELDPNFTPRRLPAAGDPDNSP
jgi:Tetratricopeptide repeat